MEWFFTLRFKQAFVRSAEIVHRKRPTCRTGGSVAPYDQARAGSETAVRIRRGAVQHHISMSIRSAADGV